MGVSEAVSDGGEGRCASAADVCQRRCGRSPLSSLPASVRRVPPPSMMRPLWPPGDGVDRLADDPIHRTGRGRPWSAEGQRSPPPHPAQQRESRASSALSRAPRRLTVPPPHCVSLSPADQPVMQSAAATWELRRPLLAVGLEFESVLTSHGLAQQKKSSVRVVSTSTAELRTSLCIVTAAPATESNSQQAAQCLRLCMTL